MKRNYIIQKSKISFYQLIINGKHDREPQQIETEVNKAEQIK